ncbi:protein of unknown function [Cupriavidus taiwanensis]|nr:protein of unknown function [Cupriavidus taiwanensis]
MLADTYVERWNFHATHAKADLVTAPVLEQLVQVLI